MIDLRQNKGFALAFSLIFVFLIVSFLAVYLIGVVYGNFEATRLANQKKAYYVAEAGLADAYEKIVNAGTTTFASSTCANTNIPSTCTVPFIPSSTTDNGKYMVATANDSSYTVSLATIFSPRLAYTITSTGTYNKISRTLQLKTTSAAISRFAYWSQTEINPDPNLGTLWWVSGMITQGPVQTNGQLNIMGNPVFNGQVTESNLPIVKVNGVPTLGTTPTSNSPNYDYGTGNNPSSTTTSDPGYIFPNTIINQAPAIPVIPATTLADFKTAATSNGLILTGASTILFNGSNILVTGKVVDPNCKTLSTYNNQSFSLPNNGETIYVQSTSAISACNSSKNDGNATVMDNGSATLNGQLTIAADQNIYIAGNVMYTSTAASSTNILGLVASQNVTVEEATAPAQLTIDGVLVAIQGSFNVDQYAINPAPIAGGLDGAVMNQFGSLINYASGCTGEVNRNGQLVYGWNQVQTYDPRLASLAPPGFPPLVNNANQGVYVKTYIEECFNGTCG